MQPGDGSPDSRHMEQEVMSKPVSFKMPMSCHPHRAPSALPVVACLAVTLALGCGGAESSEASQSPSMPTNEPFESGPRVQPPEPVASPTLPPASSPSAVPSIGPASSSPSITRPLPTPVPPPPAGRPTPLPLPTPRLPEPTPRVTAPLPTPPLPMPSPTPTPIPVDPSLAPGEFPLPTVRPTR
jgi:hypothetical protein